MIDWVERARLEIQKTAARGAAKTDETPLSSDSETVSAATAAGHPAISENAEPSKASPRVELLGLIGAVGKLYAFTPDDMEGAIEVAFSDPQAALVSFRDIAKRYALPIPTDDRVTCGECRRLVRGRCEAAKLGLMKDTQTDYSPVPDVPRNCEHFSPIDRPGVKT